MKKIIALVMGIAFAFGTAGFVAAQTAAPTPKADKMADQKAACLDKAGTDEAKKASCEKKFAKKGAAVKKEGDTMKKEGAAGAAGDKK
jgi:hypothetical protein